MLLLFFSSLFPYTTSLVAEHFNNATAQVLYGSIIIIISLMNVLLSLNLRKLNPEANFGLLYGTRTVIVALDLLFKLVGLLISMTIFPAAMVLSI
ncbi:hypothetical protein [Lacticaseibacillus paracasei]|uniref:Uncharacterized protein n=1 Tax=Lacticaseibacillus paracasei TaxID=1597 RepID=A0AAP4JK51_LACPA|nr:hypothetical protein [Lacticaseibacillus paracasei]MDE5157712.1 hypothetical protein [Lacticaseibacillus paracasei]MDM7454026.1 hypothetical protein [Lacticaseibacillus paracasei]MDM7470726.1 hypothetical protein [Lacticaseibacillus paracasei]